MNFGEIRIKVGEQLEKKQLSKSKLSQRAELQRTQLNRYIRNEVALLDRNVLARMCTVLECEISDILEFVPAEKTDEKNI